MLLFRPHHFICTLGFRGKGYSPSFTLNYLNIVNRLKDDTVIEVTYGVDHICAHCPMRQELICSSQNKIVKLDLKHAEKLSLHPYQKITWGNAKKRIANLVEPEDLDTLCSGCRWKNLGYCKEAIIKLKENRHGWWRRRWYSRKHT